MAATNTTSWSDLQPPRLRSGLGHSPKLWQMEYALYAPTSVILHSLRSQLSALDQEPMEQNPAKLTRTMLTTLRTTSHGAGAMDAGGGRLTQTPPTIASQAYARYLWCSQLCGTAKDAGKG